MVHLGIIPDGNRRWIKENNLNDCNLVKVWLNKLDLYINEILNFNEKYKYLQKITELSLYICSIDNINRDDNTKKFIFDFIQQIKFDEIIEKINKCFNTQEYYFIINFIGEVELLPLEIQELIKKLKNQYEIHNQYNSNKKIFRLHLALIYDYKNDLINFSQNNMKNYQRIQNDIDILFRSGKEKRISGFFPTKILYSELFFIDKYWPDVSIKDLNEIVKLYENRKRNFGK